ncbi:MAG TPA: CBS domain-containing protein [Myxococcota bacterium]|jgi:CBS domain-containing protein|nr:CBS domain-containing protein [Myxococcota bacterium]
MPITTPTSDPAGELEFSEDEELDGLIHGGAGADAPGGRFGSAVLREPVSVLPVRKPLVFSHETSVAEAVRAMQREHRGAVVVTADGTAESRLVGIFTERDVLHRALEGGRDLGALSLGEVMTPDPERLPVESSVAWVLNKMSVGGFRHVPIVDEEERPVFVVSVRDVVELLVDAFPREVLNLPLEYGADRQRTREGA